MSDDFDPKTVTWVLTREDLGWLLEAIATSAEVVMDLETTGLVEHAVNGGKQNGGVGARIVLASFTLPQENDPEGVPTTWVLPLSHPDSPWLGKWRATMRQCAKAMRDNERALVNQNVKFDCRWVKAQSGVDLSELIAWDTLSSSHMLDENSSTRLKERVPQVFDVKRWDDFDLTTPGAAERVPMFDLGMYAARDTYWTWRLANLHRSQMYLQNEDGEQPESTEDIENARLGKLAVWCAMPTVATLTAIEQRGLQLDDEWVRRELDEHLLEGGKLVHELSTRYDMDPTEASFAPTATWFGEWANRAVQAGDLKVAELTPTGKSRWSKGVLVRQARAGSEVADSLLTLRGHTKKAEFLTSWLGYQNPEGSIHTTYWAGRVVTGRLSSSDPNLQQVTAALKPAFIPRPGYFFVELDYSQIELRVAAFISRCIPMIEAFRRGDDLHKLLALRITGKATLLDVTPGERQAGKSANFGLLYGMSPYGFQIYAETVYGVSFTVDEAVAIHRAFFDTWDGIGAWHARCVARVNNTGQVISPIGRVRRLPGVWDGNEKVASFAERSAINSPVQGFASDLMQMAAASIEGRLPGYSKVKDVRLVGTVHDSLLAEVPQDNWKERALECQDRMVTIGAALSKLDCVFDVPLVAEAKVGTRWGLSDIGVLA